MDPRRQTSKLYHTIRSVIYDNCKGHVLESADTAKAVLRYCTLTRAIHGCIYTIFLFSSFVRRMSPRMLLCVSCCCLWGPLVSDPSLRVPKFHQCYVETLDATSSSLQCPLHLLDRNPLCEVDTLPRTADRYIRAAGSTQIYFLICCSH